MLWALLQFGSWVWAVNSPSPAKARTRRKDPLTNLSNRFSSLSSSTRSAPLTTTKGMPIMSSQKTGPSSLAIRTKLWIGADGSSDSALPNSGFVGGFGIGLNLFLGAILRNPSLQAYRSNPILGPVGQQSCSSEASRGIAARERPAQTFADLSISSSSVGPRPRCPG